MAEMQNWYEVLNLEKTADQTAIKKSYRKLVITWHPDKHPTDRERADDMIRSINNAYETLSNPAKRKAYDEQVAAFERKKNGTPLPTSSIQPRHAIPKEFMLCPLGNSQKFIRYKGTNLFVHSREDVKCELRKFFDSTKFNLFWLPEVNNMCRIRPAATAVVGQAGGMNITFSLNDNAAECELSITNSQVGQNTNFICVPSPTMVGAFRFELAYSPGAYLAYKDPNHLRIIRQMEDASKTSVDFSLVKYDSMWSYVTLEEVLIPVVRDLPKDPSGYVTLDQLLVHPSIVNYFRNILGHAPWDVEDFEIYFDAHWQQWFFNDGKVKLRTQDEQLAHALLSAKKGVDLAGPLAEAETAALEKMHIGAVQKILLVLFRDNSGASIQYAVDKLTAQKKLLTALPKIVSSQGTKDLSLEKIVSLDLLVNAIEDRKIFETKLSVRKLLADLALQTLQDNTMKLKKDGVEEEQKEELLQQIQLLSVDELEVLLTMPLDIQTLDALIRKVIEKVLVSGQTERLVALLKTTLKMKMPIFSKILGKTLLERVSKEALSQQKKDILVVVCQIASLGPGVLEETAKAKLHFDDLVEVLAGGAAVLIDENTPEHLLNTIINEIHPHLASVETLINLAKSAGRSFMIAQNKLVDICRAIPGVVKGSGGASLEQSQDLLFSVAQAHHQFRGVRDPLLHSIADEVTTEALLVSKSVVEKLKYKELGSVELTRLLLALSSICEHTTVGDMPLHIISFYEECNKDMSSRMSDLSLPQLILYTQGMLSRAINFQLQGPDQKKNLEMLLDYWAGMCRGTRRGDEEKDTDAVKERRLKLEEQNNFLTIFQYIELGSTVATYLADTSLLREEDAPEKWEETQVEEESSDDRKTSKDSRDDRDEYDRNPPGEKKRRRGESEKLENLYGIATYQVYTEFWDALCSRIVRRINRKNLPLFRAKPRNYLKKALLSYPREIRNQIMEKVKRAKKHEREYLEDKKREEEREAYRQRRRAPPRKVEIDSEDDDGKRQKKHGEEDRNRDRQDRDRDRRGDDRIKRQDTKDSRDDRPPREDHDRRDNRDRDRPREDRREERGRDDRDRRDDRPREDRDKPREERSRDHRDRRDEKAREDRNRREGRPREDDDRREDRDRDDRKGRDREGRPSRQDRDRRETKDPEESNDKNEERDRRRRGDDRDQRQDPPPRENRDRRDERGREDRDRERGRENRDRRDDNPREDRDKREDRERPREDRERDRRRRGDDEEDGARTRRRRDRSESPELVELSSGRKRRR